MLKRLMIITIVASALLCGTASMAASISQLHKPILNTSSTPKEVKEKINAVNQAKSKKSEKERIKAGSNKLDRERTKDESNKLKDQRAKVKGQKEKAVSSCKQGSSVSESWIKQRYKNCKNCGTQKDSKGKKVYYCYCDC